MKRGIFLLAVTATISALLTWSAAAQSVSTEEDKVRLSGKIIEAGPETSLPLCKITVFSSDGKIVTNAITLEDGSFQVSLKKGKYEVLIENLGYKSTKIPVVIGGSDLTLRDIVLEIGEELDAASVDATPILTRTGTRITYDVSKDPDAAKISMTEMASKIPNLQQEARRGRLEFEFKPISKILINEEENGLINASRQYPMEFIKANHMKTIEIVLPGDPEYNNSEPIMLITLAKKLPYGFAGQIQTSSDSKNSHNPAVDVVANTPLIGVGAGYSYSFAAPPALTNETIRQMDNITVENYSTSSQRSNGHIFSTNVFHSFDNDKINIKAKLSGNFSDALSLSESGTHVLDSGGELLESNLTSAVGHTTTPFLLNGALSMSGQFGKELHGLIKRLKNEWRAEYAFLQNQAETTTDYSSNTSDYTNNSSTEHRANFYLTMRELLLSPFKTDFRLHGGHYNRHYASRSESFFRPRDMDYNQQVSFLETMLLNYFFKNKLSIVIRLKGEYVANSGSVDWHEFNFIPGVSGSWRLKRGSLGLSYHQSVSRPSINQLNPYIDRRNPYYLVTGNPELKGAVTNSVSLKYSVMPANVKWIQGINAGVSWSGSNNSISHIVTADSDGTAISTYANIGSSNSLTVNTTAMLMPARKLSMMIMASYTRTWVMLPGNKLNTFDSPKVSAGFNWSPEWFQLNGNFVLQPSISSVQSAKLVLEPLGEISISRYFKKPHIGIAIIVTDVFHTGGKRESVLIGDNFTQFNYTERMGRTFRLNIYWRFGHFQSVERVDVNAYDMN
ncbi:MAG: TonB-dependent receptor [Bacteroidales bacterium]|nr:TonB-dependent receptor [Bacteroidales bacterium]